MSAEQVANPLLSPAEPPPFEIINEECSRPVLVVCDHASNRIPLRLGDLGLDPAHLEDHIAWDIGAGPVARALSDGLGATAVLANYSRLVMDLNRAPNDASSMPALSDGILVPGNLSLPRAERESRIDALFKPYHAAIASELKRLTNQHEPVLIAVHSFTPMFHGLHRPWDMGVLWEKDSRLPVRLLAALRGSKEWVVGDNEPYSGHHPADYTIDWHGERSGLAHVGIEIRQDHIATDEGQSRFAKILTDALTIVLSNRELYGRRKQ